MLYIVATPIGNLSDLSDRAREILKVVDVVACEDTRHSGVMLKKIGTNAKLISFHAHSIQDRVDYLTRLLLEGLNVAIISDAGTPGISDPGALLVKSAHEQNIAVSPVPGPSSVVAALSVCGFDTDRFRFIGFLPKKKGRQTAIAEIAKSKEVVVLFESPHRVTQTLKDFGDILEGTRKICICREITKQFEEVIVCDVADLKDQTIRAQGEFALVVNASKK